MKNALEKFIAREGLEENAAMNDLQNVGLISDNCIRAADVAQADLRAAIEFLKYRTEN